MTTRVTLAWPALEAGLNTLFARIATPPGMPAPSVVGAEQGQIGIRAPSNPTELSWTVESIRGVGRDELRTEYDADAVIPGDTYEPDPNDPAARLGGVVYSQNGHRVYTIEVRIESNEQSRPASAHGRALVSRLRLPSTQDALNALGLAYVTWDEVTDDTYDDEHGRAVSAYILSLILNGADVFADDPVTTIETSEITTTLA
jgi:hypothetical protein